MLEHNFTFFLPYNYLANKLYIYIYIYRDINAEENRFDGPPNFRMHNFDAFKKIEYKIQNFIQQQQEAGIFYLKIYQDMFFCFVFGSFFSLCFAL